MSSDPEKPAAPEGAPEPIEDFVRWDEARMATGIATIDAQHQELINRLNALHRAHVLATESDEIKKMLKFLGEYANSHFQHEEQLMEERKCPQRAENRSAHARFLFEYREMVSMYSLDPDTDQMEAEIKSMVARWLTTHICRVDIGLRDCKPPETKTKE